MPLTEEVTVREVIVSKVEVTMRGEQVTGVVIVTEGVVTGGD